MPTPLLILSDSPTAGTGLGRITKDIATRIRTHLPDVFDVGTLGYAGPQQRSLGFPQYTLDMRDWVAFNLPEVWEDFAGKQQGIVMSIWDASRMLWFSRPENCESDQQLRKFLMDPPFERWGYFPMDADGPDGKLTGILRHTIEGYDRILAYSNWAAEILDRGQPTQSHEFLPHGIDTKSFYPRHYRAARNGFGEKIKARTQKGKWLAVPTDALMVGIVATNQARKDFGVAMQAVRELARDRDVVLWIHTDVLERHWSIPSLLNDYNFAHDKAVVTAGIDFTDDQMAWCYSACDVTLGIGMSEGFGYPIFESLACGTPCIHTNDGGAAEHLPSYMKVDAKMYRMEGAYNAVRPVHAPADWYCKIKELPKRTGESLLPAHLDWENLWPQWSKWLVKGVPDAAASSNPSL